MKKDNNPFYKKAWFWVLVVAICTLVYIISPKQGDQKHSNDVGIETETEHQTTEDKYLDTMKKCTVMEAADIYTTGFGKQSNNAFDDAKETCSFWYKDWGEEEFYSAVYEDWSNRQSEEIEGQPLTYYLEILNW